MLNPLQQLAQCYGIYTSYWRVDGQEHIASDDTLISLLQAMGVSEEEIKNPQASIEAWGIQQWKQILQPVQVLKQETLQPDGLLLELSLVDEWRKNSWRWEVLTETGLSLAGLVDLSNTSIFQEQHLEGQHYVRLQHHIAQLQELPLGYHTLTLTNLDTKTSYTQRLIIVPSACYTPPSLEGAQRTWGPAVQLYSLKTERDNDWGIGNFSMLDQVCQWAASEGAGLVGLNPLGVLNLVYPEGASPYSPVSRLFINPLYIDVTVVPGFQEWKNRQPLVWEKYAESLTALPQEPLVQYDRVGSLKLSVLHELFKDFLQGDENLSFQQFKAKQGNLLKHFSLFQALQEKFQGQGWFEWPSAYQAMIQYSWEEVLGHLEVLIPEPPERNLLLHRIEFFQFLQWVADLQLSAIQENSALPIGLYLDLTVGADRGGFDTWQYQDLYSMRATIGAPPDSLGPKGQNWGLPPLIPHRLRDAAYAPVIEVFRHVMQHAGALRIDHVLGLYRLFWIPEGQTAHHGTYVAYHVEELFGIIALESVRNRCLVIGEDLGTVPPEMPERLKAWNLYSYKVARWERDWENPRHPYQEPSAYEPHAIAGFSTHDTSSLLGLFTGWFFDHLVTLGIMSQEEADTRKRGDDEANQLLLDTLIAKGLLPDNISLDAVKAKSPEVVIALSRACHCFLAQTASKVAILQAEDLLGIEAQVNIPGSTDGPNTQTIELGSALLPTDINWRRRLPVSIEAFFQNSTVLEITQYFRAERNVTPPVPTAAN